MRTVTVCRFSAFSASDSFRQQCDRNVDAWVKPSKLGQIVERFVLIITHNRLQISLNIDNIGAITMLVEPICLQLNFQPVVM